MDWNGIGRTLSDFGFAALGTAIGGPIGGVVATAAQQAVAAALGVEATPQAIQQAVEADPEAAKAKLAATDAALAHEVEMARVKVEGDRVAVDALRIDAEDRANARDMSENRTVEHKWMATLQAIMPALVTHYNYAMAIGIIVSVAMSWLREDGIIVGFAIGVYAATNNFWFGSSSGSKGLSSTVQTIATQSTTPNAAQVAGALAGQAINKAAKH